MLKSRLIEIIIKNRKNNIKDNIDYYRFPKGQNYGFFKILKNKFITIVSTPLFVFLLKFPFFRDLILSPVGKHLEGLKDLYLKLEDTKSKDILVEVLAFRILGFKRIKLRYNSPKYNKSLKTLEFFIEKNKEKKFINFSELGLDLNLNLSPKQIYDTFIYEHYNYNGVSAKKGDVVLDLGGCFGDTALYFSKIVGEEGKVYSFEFELENLMRFKTHLEKNPELKNISIIENPVWEKSGKIVYQKGTGPGAKISMERMEGSEKEFFTKSIDDFVNEYELSDVNFIKMDIEGAETFALNGAINTIQRFKPKLAISLYHSFYDFTTIHKIILNIEPKYKLYLNHCSMYNEETVLYARI